MTDILPLLLSLLCTTPAAVRIIPRHDGMLMELTSETPMIPEITLEGFMVKIRPGTTVHIPEAFMPFWVIDWELMEDSLGFMVEVSDAVDSLEYAVSQDSLTLLVFFRAAEPLFFPELSWSAPPERPLYDYDRPLYSDSATITALELGQYAPWLNEFDTIVIDPGHGGRDPGAVGPAGTFEKDRNLEISLIIRDLLNIRHPDLNVIISRETDKHLSLSARTGLANAHRADLFVSIHCNAVPRLSASGFETFFLSKARTDDARAVEMLENSAIQFDDPAETVYADPLSFLLADIAQNIYMKRSSALAVAIQESLAGTLEENINRGVKQAGFYVLRGALMPSVLVEVAFISNPLEEQMLKTLDFRFRVAEAIVKAILEFAEEQSYS